MCFVGMLGDECSALHTALGTTQVLLLQIEQVFIYMVGSRAIHIGGACALIHPIASFSIIFRQFGLLHMELESYEWLYWIPAHNLDIILFEI